MGLFDRLKKNQKKDSTESVQIKNAQSFIRIA
jgi:hypothetical protein